MPTVAQKRDAKKQARKMARNVIHFRSFVPAELAPVTLKREEGKPVVVQGYGAVFYRSDNPGTEYWLFRDLVERIGRSAFDRAIKEDDVRALFNHDPNLIMGRSTSGTLRLTVDDTGLRYEYDLPNSPNGKNMEESLARKDVTGSSFSFDIIDQDVSEEDDFMVSELRDVKLYDVGPVTFPAYTAATAGIRSEFSKGIAHVRMTTSGQVAYFDDRKEYRSSINQRFIELGPTRDSVEVEVEMALAKMRRR